MPIVNVPITATSISDLVNETKANMYGYYKEIINVLDGDITATDLTIKLADSFSTIGVGVIVAIDDELIYVRGSNPGGLSLDPVIRGWLGSTPAIHYDGAIVEIGSRFNSFALKRLLKQEIQSWPTEVFREAYVDLEFGDSTVGYDLSGLNTGVDDFRFPLQFSIAPTTSASDGSNWGGANSWRIERNLPSTSFASGNAVILDVSRNSSGRLTVAQDFDLTNFETSLDLESDCGLFAGVLDIPAMGAAWRALSSRETKRSFTEAQGEPRKAEEVPPMYQMQAANAMKKLRDQRLGEEAKKLRDKYPVLMLS